MFQRNKLSLIDDSNYSLTGIDFIELIESAKTIIEFTEIFMIFAKLIDNFSFFLPSLEAIRHNLFIKIEKRFTKSYIFIFIEQNHFWKSEQTYVEKRFLHVSV
jgi:hypothetical protein